jgi:hypothetical protein
VTGQETPESPDLPETQEQRAMRTIQSIFAGGDVAAETLQLSNEFTDRQVERMTRALRRQKN